MHVGVWSPARWDEIDAIRVGANPGAWGKKRRPSITSQPVGWSELGLTPRWVDDDSSESVAAIEPSLFHAQGADEWRRFIMGSTTRGELALAVSTVGSDEKPNYVPLEGLRAGIGLPGAPMSNVGGQQVVLATPPQPAAELNPVDRDLALRIVGSRPVDLPWWQLRLSGSEWHRSAFNVESASDEGQLTPMLVTGVGEVAAAIWTSADGRIRHYILPFMPSWRPILEWLSHHAIPYFVPSAMRRVRRSLALEPALWTIDEAEAHGVLHDLETEFERRSAVLRAAVNEASAAADAVRDPLIYGTGKELVGAVAQVLQDASVAITDLDELFGGTVSADLLAAWSGRRVLIEVKSAGGNLSESLAEAPARHLTTWPQIRPNDPVDGAVMVVNHQARVHPLERPVAPYMRPEFVRSLPFPVVTGRQLYDWWRARDFTALRDALFASVGGNAK